MRTVFIDPVFQGYSINPEIVSDLLESGSIGVLVQSNGVAFELHGIGLGWHDR